MHERLSNCLISCFEICRSSQKASQWTALHRMARSVRLVAKGFIVLIACARTTALRTRICRSDGASERCRGSRVGNQRSVSWRRSCDLQHLRFLTPHDKLADASSVPGAGGVPLGEGGRLSEIPSAAADSGCASHVVSSPISWGVGSSSNATPDNKQKRDSLHDSRPRRSPIYGWDRWQPATAQLEVEAVRSP